MPQGQRRVMTWWLGGVHLDRWAVEDLPPGAVNLDGVGQFEPESRQQAGSCRITTSGSVTCCRAYPWWPAMLNEFDADKLRAANHGTRIGEHDPENMSSRNVRRSVRPFLNYPTTTKPDSSTTGFPLVPSACIHRIMKKS